MTTFYTNKSNATHAARKAVAKADFPADFNIVAQKDGTFAYELLDMTPEAPARTGRGGGRKFMTGVGVRRSDYDGITTGAKIFQVCDFLAKRMDPTVPYRCHVVRMCKVLGIKESSARAGYTHWKQVRKLDSRAGRPTEEAEHEFEQLVATLQ
ncbi:MAG: hypothetical protein FKY71_08105 [Spiribacter salinus]|uniref:Uncharacterized protein n=1 Tax=Spiribacter salinus TaxID=1335746 RepID=A0A540VRZ4_9GAMM|nr:MAG: hypothetical protein FKY71_08105 [Spiribacter salinus]